MFDFFKKKKPATNQVNNSRTDATSLFRAIVQDVAICMMQLKITSQPVLRFFNNDQGLLEGIYQQHTSDPNILAIKNMSEDTFARICGMHAFGAGAYATLMQGDFDKAIGTWNNSELLSIVDAFKKTDAYELALNKLGYPLDGNNKKVCDHIIMTGLQSTIKNSGLRVLSNEALKIYMQVMFNAGITLVLR